MDSTIVNLSTTFSNWIELIGHLIWPVAILIFLCLYKDKISTLFDSIRKLKFADFEAEFDKIEKTLAEQEVSPLNDEIDSLRKRIEKLEKDSGVVKKPKSSEEPKMDEVTMKNRVIEAIENGPYRWRSIPRIASISGITENRVLEILRNDVNVVLSKGKSGKRIARLKNK